jgi:hypothetical protein
VARLTAAALVNSDGTFPVEDHPGFSAVVHSGTGVYQLTLTSPPANPNNLIVTSGIVGFSPSFVTFINPTPNIIEVHTFDVAGTAVDRVFEVIAFDTTP